MLIEAHDSNLWRIERVQKAIKVSCAILGMTKEQLAQLVFSIRDQKGELVVLWNHEWTQRQVDAFQVAWNMCGENNVRHEMAVF